MHIDIGVGPTRPSDAAWRPRAILTLALLVSTMAAMAIINPMNSMDDGESMRRLKTSESLSHFFRWKFAKCQELSRSWKMRLR